MQLIDQILRLLNRFRHLYVITLQMYLLFGQNKLNWRGIENSLEEMLDIVVL